METKQLQLNFSKKDNLLIGAVMCLAGLGLIMIYSASAMTALQKYGDSFYFLKRQAVWIIITVFISLLIVVEPDLGTVLVISIGSGLLLFIGGARILHIAGLFLTFLPVVIILIVNVGYRSRRITAFLHPWDDPGGVSYQIVQSFLAFGNGGISGRGIGGGRRKLFFLPEAHTDFIFSVIGEEFGFAGCVAVTLLFMFFLW